MRQGYSNYSNHSSKGGNFGKQGKSDGNNAKNFWEEKKSEFKESWITEGADEALPRFAEDMGRYMSEKRLSNSKIRSIYGELKRIQSIGFDRSAFCLLKPKVAYAVGREHDNDGLKLFKILYDTAQGLVNGDNQRFKNFCDLMEAVVAYHKFYGDKGSNN